MFIQKIGHASARYWAYGYISAGCSFAAPLLLISLPFEVYTIIANTLFLCAFFFYGHALLVHFQQPLYIWARLSLLFIAISLISFYILTAPDLLKHQFIISDVVCTLLLSLPLLIVRKKPVIFADRLMVTMAWPVVLEILGCITMLLVMTPSGTMVEMDRFLASNYAFFMQTSASVFGFLLAFSVLASQISVIVERHRHAAEHDPLTDALNRRGFENRVPDFRNGTPEGAVVVCDIDHFKNINDVYGHAAGDMILADLSSLLKKSAPENALVARFGGEEFVIFLPGHTAGTAGQIANRIRLDLRALNWHNQGVMAQAAASFGVSAVARGDHSIHDAIKRADSSLYIAKRGGRDRVSCSKGRFFQPWSKAR